MSEKKAKELRKAQPVIKIEIHVMQDSRVEVFGFPNNFDRAMQVMNAGAYCLAKYFIQKAIEGKVDDKLNLEQSRIVKPFIAPTPLKGLN